MSLSLSTLLGLAGCAVAYVAVLMKVTALSKQSLHLKLGVFAMALFFALFPVLDEPLVIYFRGTFGDFSVATLLLAGAAIYTLFTQKAAISDMNQGYFYLVVVMMAVLLYPFALGWGQADTYRLGYDNPLFEWLIWGLAVVAVFARCYFIAVWLLLSLISYALTLYESHNLWDYLIDPVISLIAISYVIKYRLFRPLVERAHTVSLKSI